MNESSETMQRMARGFDQLNNCQVGFSLGRENHALKKSGNDRPNATESEIICGKKQGMLTYTLTHGHEPRVNSTEKNMHR